MRNQPNRPSHPGPLAGAAALVLGLILVVGLAGCSSSKHAPSAGGTQAHLEKKATEAAKAFVAGKYDATYQYLDATCQKRWTQQTWAANAAAAAADLKSAGIDLSQDHVGSVTATNFTPTSATVTAHILNGSGQDATSSSATTVAPQAWVHQNGRWLTSACSAASTGATSGTGALVPATNAPG